MQVPHQTQGGSAGPYAQAGGDPRNSSPYPPYQHQSSPPVPPYQQSPYGQQQYGQQGYPESAPPSHGQANYAPYGRSPPPSGYGYDNRSHSPYDASPPAQHQYQHQAPYHPPGQPPANQYNAPAGFNYQPGQQGPSTIAGPGNGPSEDRGVMGALAGGATGAYAGHKVNHGIIGALGGAFAGHKLQDAVGDRRKKKKKNKKSRSSSCSSSSSSDCSSRRGSPAPPPKHQPPAPKYAGNFSGSATQITLDRDYDLIAMCGRMDGGRKLSSINLNRCLTNSDGHFKWSREGNFGASARNVRLVDGGRVLEGELANCGGHWVWARIALDEKIGNNNGELVMV